MYKPDDSIDLDKQFFQDCSLKMFEILWQVLCIFVRGHPKVLLFK